MRIVIADDQAMMRQLAKTILESDGFEVVGEASNGKEAVEQCQRLQPEIAVLDLAMPVMTGIDATREITRACPETSVIILSVHTEEFLVRASLRAGAKGYVSKAHAARELIEAIHAVRRAETYLDSCISPRLAAAS